MRNVNAGELSTEFLLGNGANCATGVGECHYHPEYECYAKYRNKTDNAGHCQERESKINRLKCIRDIDRPRICAECIKEGVFDDDGDSEGDQQHIAVVAM